MSNPKDNLIKYGLRAIETARFNLTLPHIKVAEGQVPEINYNIDPSLKYIIKEDLILITVVVKGFIKQTEEVLLEAENVFVYHAINLQDYLNYIKEENTWKFKNPTDEGLLVTLIGVSVSTMRGIVFEKSKGTILQFSPVPILDPSTFIKKKK